MVYVNSDGSVCNSQPWSLNRVTKIFYGIIAFVVLFFKTLVGLDGNSSLFSSRSGGSSGYRGPSSWFGSSGGGGGGSGGGRPGGGGGGGGQGGGSSRRFMTMRDINPPRVGGCPGGSCGM